MLHINVAYDQLIAVKTGYPLTSITWPHRGLRCRPIEVKYFFKLSANKLLVFKWSQAQVWFFKKNHMKYVVFMCRTIKIWSQTDLGRENSESYYRQSRVGHALRPIFMLWLIKIWQVSSCGKLMQHFESTLFNFTAEADRGLCQLVMFLTVFFYWMYKMKFSCYQESSVIHG